MRRAGWFLLLAGCLSKPPRPDDLGPELPSCTTPTITDTFDDPFAPVCGVGFEDTDVNSITERSGGVLHQRPGANVINDASCTWASFDFSQGTFVHLRRPLSTGGSFTILQFGDETNGVGIEVLDDAEPVLLMFERGLGDPIAMEPYDSSEMQWLRLRPQSGQVSGEYSADGKRWKQLAITTVTPSPTDVVTVSLNAGIYNPLADPGDAEFDNFNVCPP